MDSLRLTLSWFIISCCITVSQQTHEQEQLMDSLPEIDVSGCGVTKGCYRAPSMCNNSQDCVHLLTWTLRGKEIDFEISALTSKTVQWTAVGLSLNQKMGYDSVTDCIYDTAKQVMVIQSSWNNAAPTNVPLQNKTLGMVSGSSKGSYSDGRIQCAYTRYITVVNSTEGDPKASDNMANPIYSINQPFYLFLARGPANGDIKSAHTEAPAVSPELITLNSNNYVNIGGKPKHPDFPEIDVSSCGVTKGCYRTPSMCNNSQDCVHLLTWTLRGKEIDFEISALTSKTVQWTAVGLSLNQKMGYDSVTDCIYDIANQSMIIQSSWNNAAPNNVPLQNLFTVDGKSRSGGNNEFWVDPNRTFGIVPGSSKGSYSDGRIQCAYTRYITVVNSTEGDPKASDNMANPIYSNNQPFYLFLARGPANGDIKSQHTESPAVSPEMITLNSNNYVNVGGNQKYPLVIAHGSLMIIAWMVFASIGILMPRYFKESWASKMVMNKMWWFQIHRLLMILVVILTCLAFLLIVLQVRGYPTNLKNSDAAHPVLGIIVTVLIFINPMMAIFRPDSNSPYRPVFNSLHFTAGTIAHVLAAIAMYIGTRLSKSAMSDWTPWIVLSFAIWHVVTEMLLRVHQRSLGFAASGEDIPYEKLLSTTNDPSNGQMSELASDYERTKSVGISNGNVFKTVVIVLHFVVVVGCSSTLIHNLIAGK